MTSHLRLIKILIPMIFLLSSCSVINSSPDQPTFESTHWKLIALNQKAMEPSDEAFIEFNGTKLSGKAACNRFSGEYELKRSKVTFSAISATKMFCNGLMDQESQILSNLQKAKRFEIRYGLLYLYGEEGLLMTYKR